MVTAPIGDPAFRTFTAFFAIIFPPVISPFPASAFTVLPAITFAFSICSASTNPAASTSAADINFAMIFPPALSRPLFCPCIPLAMIISPSASISAPSTTPLTKTFPFVLIQKFSQTFPLTSTSP